MIRNFFDLKFTVVAVKNEHCVDFAIYEIDKCDSNKEIVFWHKKNSDIYPDPVKTLDEADIFLHGSIKWDGCSNWYFDEQDKAMLHGCTRDDLVRFGEMMARCWDWNLEITREGIYK